MARKPKEPKVKIGDRFDKLTVIEQVEVPMKITEKNVKKSTNKIKKWLCKCDCGETIILSESTLLSSRSTLRSCNKCPSEINPNHISKKMTFEEQQAFEELYEYVKTNIFGYDKSQSLPQVVVSRLQGLRYGKYMANNKSKNNANYSDEVILNTFKFCFPEIQRALRINNFKDEQHKINYVAKIIENNINNVYTRMKAAEKSQKEIEKVDMTQTVEYVNTFKKKEDKKINDRLSKLLW